MNTLVKTPEWFPNDITLLVPTDTTLAESDHHFLYYIPWNTTYLKHIPDDFKNFFKEILPHLSARTTDVHTAVCLQYLDEFIQKAQKKGHTVNRKVVAYALILHDAGWSQMSQTEIAASLGVQGLVLNEKALAPKEKHAKLGADLARKILTSKQSKLELTTQEIELICTAILYHDRPELVAGQENTMPMEIQLLVDLDHIWSFTYLNFWQDTVRKGVKPSEYLLNLKNDLDSYFVTNIGKSKAMELLSEREKEVDAKI